MKHIINLSIMATIAIIGLAATVSLAFTVPNPNPIPSVIQGFKCGPGLFIYKSVSLGNNGQIIGNGMRCLKPTYNQNVATGPYFSWYGEGTIGTCTNRTLGHAFFGAFTNSPSNTATVNKASAADIWGNGECRQQNFPNLLINTSGSLNTIKVTGGLTEIWTRVSFINYTPLPRINSCGNPVGLTTLKAVDGPGFPVRTGGGIRCVLNLYQPQVTWFGNGYWNNPLIKYSELGNKQNNNYGTSSITGGIYGVLTYFNPFGSYTINWSGSPEIVSPVKDELWY